ncbi:hypothetical protein RUND412_005058 [Rhizina undulata]
MASPSSFDDFKRLLDALFMVGDTRGLDMSGLAEELEKRTDELKNLLDTPPKSDISREKVKSGTLELDGTTYKLNDTFIQETIQLADDLNIDEITAALFLHRGSQEAQHLDRSPFQSAVFLYHTRRNNLLESLRLIFSHISNERLDPDIRGLLENFIKSLTSATSKDSFSAKCIATMGTVRQLAIQLREKESHSQTLGIELPQSFKEDINIQVRFLTNQHEALASIVYYLVKHKKAALSDFKNLLGIVKSFDKYDIFTYHHVLPMYAFVNMLCSTDSPLGFEETIQLHKEMVKNYKESPWPLRYIQASVQIWWLSEFNGLCNDPPSTNAPSLSKLDYTTDISIPSKAALADGAFEFLLGVSSDVSDEIRLNAAKEEIHRFLQSQVPPMEDRRLLSTIWKLLVVGQFELFIDNFISNMADLLKDIKTREEEDVLLDRGTVKSELERFFLIIHYIYLGRRDAGMSFWGDPESNLHGFIVWASMRPTPFMAATFSYMLASLSFGKECAAHAHRFLSDEVSPGTAKNRRSVYLSWEFIFKQFQLYLSHLEKRQQVVPAASYRPMPPPTEIGEPGPELSMMLDGFMRLAAQIMEECPEARQWLLMECPNFRLVIALFELLNLQATKLLWDSIFHTIAAFLTEKTENLNDQMWTGIDQWALGPPTTSSPLQLGTTTAKPFASAGGSDKFDSIVTSIHPAEAFVHLLDSLVSPPVEDAALKDALPFPENLGSSTRKTGIDPYVDFVLGTIFSNTTLKNLPWELPPAPDKPDAAAEKLARAQYTKFRPALQLSCLQFIHTCLSTFNEDLLEIDRNSNVSVDTSMKCSSLATYVKFHPFARVMEHLLTEKCFNVLFEILKSGVDILIGDHANLPVVETVLITIQIIDLAMKLQPTFLDIRTRMNQDDGIRRQTVSTSGFSSFEDAVLYHLDIVVYLGLYVGIGNQNIALVSLRLLEKLSTSRKLISTPGTTFGRQPRHNRVLGVVDQNSESRRIIFGFIHQWEAEFDFQDKESRFFQKLAILKLLESCLSALPNEYTLTHLLLGFGYDEKEGVSLSVVQGGVGSGVSLLHSILDTLQTMMESDNHGLEFDGNVCRLRNSCFRVLRRLWKSPLTSGEMLYVLRANKFLFREFMGEATLSSTTLWDGIPFGFIEFFTQGAALGFCNFLQRRTSLFDYISLEIRQLSAQGASTMVARYLSTLLGITITPEARHQHVHILDLVDFLELDAPEAFPPPSATYFHDLNLVNFQQEDAFGALVFDLPTIGEILLLKRSEFLKSGGAGTAQSEAMQAEIKELLDYLFAENELRQFKAVRLECLKAWTTLIVVMLEDCEFETSTKTGFLLQALQTILPKLELYCSGDIASAEELSFLADFLISHMTFDTSTFGKGRTNDIANDRLYQLFRVSLRCIQSPLATAKLREDFYNIAYRYLKGMCDISDQGNTVTRHNIQTIKASGDRLLEVICNDAYSGEGNCKIVALLLLESLTALAANEGSNYVIDSLLRQNFLVVLVDSIKRIGYDLQNTRQESISYLMRSFKAATGFLLRISQTRVGAGHVLNAGLFQALRESRLFSVDPDLGVGFNDPKALEKYYELLLNVMRVVTSCILSRGPQNRQTIEQGRQFLSEARNVAITVFKRHANIGGPRIDITGDLKDLMEMFVLLFSLTDFVELEEGRA